MHLTAVDFKISPSPNATAADTDKPEDIYRRLPSRVGRQSVPRNQDVYLYGL